jgi:N-acetylglucosaminyldiphosphoundecaprenol N-acetyl-beta-D-mannosaminyltransferase
MPILGVPVAAINIRQALDIMTGWIASRHSAYICATDVNSVMRAQDDARHMEALRAADLIIADGTPLVWIARLRGERRMSRVCGPDLFTAACAASTRRGWRHYLVGGMPGVADELASCMKRENPGLEVVGVECPPFRSLTAAEDEEMLARINAAKPDIVWVGLGCPKQERWMLEHRPRLPGIVLVGISAAFDFHTERVKRAPIWMRTRGLEWLHRLMSEPRRLWRRYLVKAPRFIVASLVETARVKRSAPQDDHAEKASRP